MRRAAVVAAACAALAGLSAAAQTQAQAQKVPPLDVGGAWQVVGLPDQTLPMTRYAAVEVDGEPAVRIEADASYGNLGYRTDAMTAPRRMQWRWRLDAPVAGADLTRKEGDDAALKVCALFDLPLEALPFLERQKMRLARAVADEWLPAATLCYVWDPALAPGTVLPNAYTPRLRWIVARGQGAALGQWQAERHDLHADFLRAFGDEAQTVPPLRAIAVGADADNTGGSSRALIGSLTAEP